MPKQQPTVTSPGLGRKIGDALDEAGRTQTALAKFLGITQPSVSEAIKTNRLAKEHLPKLVEFFGKPYEYWLGVAGHEESEFAFVPRARVEASAGHGALIFDEGTESALSFRRDYLREQGVSEKNAVVVTVKGTSMEPGIADGAVLLVNRAGAARIKNGLIYAFRLDGELFVKQLFQDSEGIIARSDNPDKDEYPDMLIDARSQDFEVIGRAIWMGRKL